jgi:hypothetical protein
VGGQRMGLLVSRIRVLKDRLEGDSAHRPPPEDGLGVVDFVLLQYHANHPRRKRLVQRPR